MTNASGLKVREGILCENDAVIVNNLKRAGAIPFIVTNVSECCMWYESANKLYGRTNNAYNTTRIVGGSSGKLYGRQGKKNLPKAFYDGSAPMLN